MFIDAPIQFQDMLIDLKVQAEGLVRLANNIDGLLTCVLRPSNIFGPGDTQFVPLLVNLAKSGLAKVCELSQHHFICLEL